MAEGGTAQQQDPDQEELQIRQNIIDKIFATLPKAVKFQEYWARSVGNGQYAEYVHQPYAKTRATYQGRPIDVWAQNVITRPNKRVLDIKELSETRTKPMPQWLAAAMIGGRMRILTSNDKNGEYRDIGRDQLLRFMGVDLNGFRWTLEGLAKPPRLAAGEPKWPQEVHDFAKKLADEYKGGDT